MTPSTARAARGSRSHRPSRSTSRATAGNHTSATATLRQQAEERDGCLRIEGVGDEPLPQRTSGGLPPRGLSVRARLPQGPYAQVEHIGAARQLQRAEQRRYGGQDRATPATAGAVCTSSPPAMPRARATPARRETRALRTTTVKSAPDMATMRIVLGCTRPSDGRGTPAMYDPTRLAALVAVAEAGSITRAAERLGYTTPALSQQLAKL